MSNLIVSEANDENKIDLISNSNLDIQISTAQKYKRKIEECRAEALGYIKSSRAMAASCNYARPITNKGKADFIRGPSIRLAEIAVSAYGHIHSASRIIETTSSYVVAETVVWDVQKNIHRIEPVTEPIRFRGGEIMATQSAIAKSYRNAVFKVLPRAWLNELSEIALDYAINGDDENDKKDKTPLSPTEKFHNRRNEVFEHLEKRGVPIAALFTFFNKKTIEEFNESDIKDLIGIGTAIRDGIITIENIFSIVDTNPNSDVGTRYNKLMNQETVEVEKLDDIEGDPF